MDLGSPVVFWGLLGGATVVLVLLLKSLLPKKKVFAEGMTLNVKCPKCSWQGTVTKYNQTCPKCGNKELEKF